MIKRTLILLVFLLLNLLCLSQRQVFAEIKPYVGFVAPHRIGMESLAQNYTFGTEVNVLFRNTNPTFYNLKYGFPYKGIGISFESLGNPDVLGNSFSVYSILDFKITGNSKLSLNTRLCPGLAYLTKRYDRYLNPENIALGTHLCFYFNLNFSGNYHFDQAGIDIRLSGGLIHYSNGSVRKPNLGLNQLYMGIGISKEIITSEKTAYKEYSRDHLSPHEFWAMGTYTVSDDYSIQPEGRGGGFPCISIACGYNYQYSGIGKFGISADLFYNSNFMYYFDTNWDILIKYYDNVSDVLRSGISFGHQLIYNRLELVTFAGVYFYNKIKPGDFLYTRIGVRYYICDYVFVNLTLKAFGFKAHYIEPGIGFSFRKREI
ncbi:MAG TPA: acyloxyacyl hydrolase [Bacteroidales bacterium]|nr:acyloxyacyl hydrolase [Bacteroidales bacterium]